MSQVGQPSDLPPEVREKPEDLDPGRAQGSTGAGRELCRPQGTAHAEAREQWGAVACGAGVRGPHRVLLQGRLLCTAVLPPQDTAHALHPALHCIIKAVLCGVLYYTGTRPHCTHCHTAPGARL